MKPGLRLFNLKQISLKKNFRAQLSLAFLTMSSLVIFTALLTVLYTSRMQRNSSRILTENVASLKAAEELEIALLNMHTVTHTYLLDRNPALLQTYERKQNAFRTWLALARKRAFTPPEQRLVDSIASSFQNYIALQQLMLNLERRGQKREARELRSGALQSQFDRTYQLCEKLTVYNEQLMRQTSAEVKQANQQARRIVSGLAIGSILLALALGVLLSRRFIRPIYRLVLNIKGATGEEPTNQVELGNISELDDLSQNINLLIDKIRTANAELAKSQQSLIRSEKLAALGRMAAGLAHEIRNPLTAIKMLLFPLENELSDKPRYRQDLQIIHQEIDRLDKFIQTFLDFARPQQPHWSVFRCNELIQQVLHLMAPQLKKQKVKLVLSLKTNADWVKADRNQLQQVLYNIILNALQAMPHGGLLTISTESLINDAGLPYLQVRIADTGRGIAPEILNSLFDPFVTTKEDGSGLGLAIVHQLVSANGGWVEARNNPDRGACFSINLPQEKGEP